MLGCVLPRLEVREGEEDAITILCYLLVKLSVLK